MEITIKNNHIDVIKKSFEVSIYALIFSLFIPALFFLLGIFLDKIFNPIHSYAVPLITLGITLLTLGAVFLLVSIFYLGKTGRGLPASPAPPVNLVRSGPYAVSRHPIYLGASLSFLGASLLSRSFWCIFLSWPLFTLFFMIYAKRIEEPVLEERFGKKYCEYKKNVPMFCEFPLRKTFRSLTIHLLNFLSRMVNTPFILKAKSHRLFLGYGLWVGTGSIMGLSFMSIFLFNANIPVNTIIWLATIFTFASLVLSRLVSMLALMNIEKVSLNAAWFRVGFVSWGALAAALLTGLPYFLLTHKSLYIWYDAALTGLMIAHFFGRIGCLFYGCCYGKETRSSIRIQYKHPCLKALRENRVKNGNLYPVQLFSALYGLFIFLMILSLWSLKGINIGIPTSLTLILYGIFRFMEEWFRYQKKKIMGIFSPAQMICLVLIILGMTHFIWLIQAEQFGMHIPLIHISLGKIFNLINLLILGGLGMLTTLTFSYHRYEIGLWGKGKPLQQFRSIMELCYKDSTLHCQEWPLSQLTERFGTPLYVIDKGAVHESIEKFRCSFQALSVPVKIHYSVKTNPVPGFLKIIKDEGLNVELISEHELILCRKLGYEWESIIINGPAKSKDFLKKVKNSKVKMVVIESISDFERLENLVADAARPLNVGVRICPGFSWAKLKPTLNSGRKNSPYGFPADSFELWSIMKKLKRNKNFLFMGFHMHLGSGIKDSRPYKKAFIILERIIKKAQKMGMKSSLIDIGGGFGLATAPIMNISQLIRPNLLMDQSESPVAKSWTLLDEVVQYLEAMLIRLRSSDIHIKEILVEPGRIISGPSEFLILSVLDVIKRSDKSNYVICDSGALSLSPLLFTEYHRILPLAIKNGQKTNYTILGNMPSSLDKLSSSTALSPLLPGDQIALLDTGAYIGTMNNNFAGPRPAIVLLDGKKAQLTRRRESIEEMYQRDYF